MENEPDVIIAPSLKDLNTYFIFREFREEITVTIINYNWHSDRILTLNEKEYLNKYIIKMIDLKLLKKDIELMFGIPDIGDRSSNQKICTARAIYYEIARNKTKLSYKEIGLTIGVSSHALVFGGIKKLPIYLKSNPEFKTMYDQVLEKLGLSKADYYEIKFNDMQAEISRYKNENIALKEKLKGGPKEEILNVEREYLPLIKLLYQVPNYHIETVKLRLAPIIKMLEKPSIHNNLPMH